MLRPLVVAVLALCAGCSSLNVQGKDEILRATLTAYANALRWGGFDQAMKYVDPDLLKEHPLSSIELERYKQVQVVSYMEQPVVPSGKDEVTQRVDISILNVHTQTSRALVDRQTWRYHEDTKHWYLVSGLPDITQR